MNELDNFKYFNNKTPFFTLSGLKTPARIVNVVDGDTLTLIIPIFDSYYKFYTRISGIDTCETHSKDEKIKELGLKAKYRVLELLLSPPKNIIEIMGITNKQIIDIFDKDVYIINIECGDFDKYGRLLANVFINDGRSIASVLLEEKLAYKYDGKTKLTEEEQFAFLT
jgi:endonuclease YncB( thermonuclease family)